MKKIGMIAASMMCSRLCELNKEIHIFEQEQIDYLHIDIMDGEFVPNLGLGVDYIRGLRELTKIPLDLHLMINRPEDKFTWFDIQPGDIVTIHYESTIHLNRTLERAHINDNKVFLAISPGTPIYVMEEVLGDIDGINMLMVNPGFSGQTMIKGCVDKAKRLKKFLCEKGYGNLLLEADGNITFQHANELYRQGVDMFVAGTSSIFRNTDILENIRNLKKSISKIE